MKRDIAVQWSEWLLSNPDVRGEWRLAPDDNHRCCLGLLQDMLGCEYERSHYALTEEAMQAAGVRTNNGAIPSIATSLSQENDLGVPWEKTALLIEKHSDEI